MSKKISISLSSAILTEPFDTSPQQLDNISESSKIAKAVHQSPALQTEIQNYWVNTGLSIPASAPIVKQTIADTYNSVGYKIFKSSLISVTNFAIAAYAPGAQKIALAHCNRLVPMTTFKKMFLKLWSNNTPAVVEVGIINGGYETEAKVNDILNYLEGRNNVNIKFYYPAASTSSKELAIDTLGHFSTDCTGIKYNARPCNNLNHLLIGMLPISTFVTGEAPANSFED